MPDTGGKLTHERWVGRRLSHFRLMRVLGSGAMGVVFQVEDLHLKRIAALKVLKRQMQGEAKERQVERFLLEARSAASIDHPAIAQVYEINEHRGWWYIAMEFLEGGSLKDVVTKGGPLAPGRAALMMVDATRGIAAAHEAGVIHRDIKPGNLMLSRRGRCKVVDFGLVRLDSAEDPFRDEDSFAGTPSYIAPELIRRKPVTPAADVYSLGGTLFNLLTGHAPYRGDSIDDVLEQHVQAEIPDVREFAPAANATVAELIQATMAKDPEARPSAESLAAILQAEVPTLLATDPASGGVPVADQGGHSSVIRSGWGSSSMSARAVQTKAGGHKSRWVVGVMLLVILLGGAAWIFRGALPFSSVPGKPEVIGNSIEMQLVKLPAGESTIGSPPTEAYRNIDERMTDVMHTRDVFMSATEVTQGQWAKVMGEDYVPAEGVHADALRGPHYIGDSLPAYASWFEAMEFCRLLSVQEGRLYRLPTEAEWERACRAGADTAYNVGDDLDRTHANVDTRQGLPDGAPYLPRPVAVASYPANAWGFYDMHGNVMEWCGDWKDAYPVGPLTDPNGAAQGDRRVIRGGSWDMAPNIARSANRWGLDPVIRTDYIGFRVVMDPEGVVDASVSTFLPDRSAAPMIIAEAPDLDAIPSSMPRVDGALPAYEPTTALTDRMRTAGSDSMNELMLRWERAFRVHHPDLSLRHEGRGSGTAIPALAEGVAQFGPMSRPLKDEERARFQEEFGYEPAQVAVAVDTVSVFVHPENPIAAQGLSLDELVGIFAARDGRDTITWGDLGLTGAWQNEPIEVYSRNQASGTAGVFRDLALGGAPFRSTNIELVGSDALVEAVAASRFAIGFSGSGYANERVVAVPLALHDEGARIASSPETALAGTYPLTRSLFLAYNRPVGAPMTPLQREFFAFVFSEEGQRIVAESGFYPLSAARASEERPSP